LAFVRAQEPAERRPRTQGRKIIAGDEESIRPLGPAGLTDVERYHAEREQVGERAQALPKIAVLEPRHAGVRAGLRARLDELKAGGIGHAGQRLKDHGLHPREHRRVHADPDSERHDHHGRDRGHSPDHPPRVMNIVDARHFSARPANSRVSVCTLIFSPSLMNSGTRISMPVSSVATLVTLPVAVSPRAPASAEVTARTT